MSLECSAATLQSLQLLFGLNITREPAWTVRGSHPGGEDFLARLQTGFGAQPASCRMGTGLLLAVNRLGRGVDRPLSSSTEVK
jgi:hypothetical protein